MISDGSILKLIALLYPFDYSIAGTENDRASEVLKEILPFTITEYPSEAHLNGWVIPKGWRLNFLGIYLDNQVLFHLDNHPFCVPKNTHSVDVSDLSYSQLISHINRSASGRNNDFVYDWKNLYRNEPLEWSICLSEEMVGQLTDKGVYRVVIDSTFYDSNMKVLEFDTHPDAEATVIINAHNCHPFQANDDVSGIVAGILLAKLWSEEKNPKINLKLLIAPELYGPIFFLDEQKDTRNFLGSLLFKAVGNEGTLKLQESIQMDSEISKIAKRIFQEGGGGMNIHPFRTLYGNDEIVFENPPYCIPSITLTRVPFNEHHNSSDTPDSISTLSIAQSIDSALRIVRAVDGNARYRWLMTGLYKLSDLHYDLYKPTRAQGIHNLGDGEVEKSWHILMNSIPALVQQGADSLMLSEKFNLPILEVIQYLLVWEKAGLVERSGRSG